MKLHYKKEWFERHIAPAADEEIGAGFPAFDDQDEPGNNKPVALDTRIALGHFIELWRRNMGWNAEQLASAAQVDVEEILEIERDPYCDPEPNAIYKLAKLFNVPSRQLLELAALVDPRNPELRREAIRFAARSESISALSKDERHAFEAFVAALTEKHKTQ